MGKIEFYESEGFWRWRLKSRNGRVVATSFLGYDTLAACQDNHELVQKYMFDAEEVIIEGPELKTSAEWERLDNTGIIIIDPDGWDRKNYQFSFYEEKITLKEYENRRIMSTCKIPQEYMMKLANE